MKRGGYRRNRYKGHRSSHTRYGPYEYDESSEDRPDYDDGYLTPGPPPRRSSNSKHNGNPRLKSAPKKSQPFQRQANPFQQSSSHTHNDEQQPSGEQPEEEGIHHYHHHNHYYHHPNGTSPLPTQTATGMNNDIMMTDFSAINALEGRLSKLGSEILEFLNAMASQSNQTKEFIGSFVNYLRQAHPDSELSRVLGGIPSQQNRPQAPAIAPTVPPGPPPANPFTVPAITVTAPTPPNAPTNASVGRTGAFGRSRNRGGSVDSEDGRNMTPIMKRQTRFVQ
ncbi:hypothetical protein GL218_02554 [Daldinia childiae]|uniref:uncharacterized protein n=1 Tax=Daldinia childiae TaxID=326645 RepID=UPI0014488D81|nr:uncharacterized protein GL218_02554 [Daldinia childiae]KAF3064997.1 hypothetical protein GL218_02554 [Daldinia childiae]